MTTAMQKLITKIVTNHGEADKFCDTAAEPHYALRVENAPYMRLVIERMYAADHGRQVVSVAHYYSQNGDAMRDPEMCFDFLTWEPLYFLQDNLGIEQYVYTSPAHTHYRPRLRRELISFATQWARNLNEQGFSKCRREAQ